MMLFTDITHVKNYLFEGRDNLKSAYAAGENADFNKALARFIDAKRSFIRANDVLNDPSIKLLMPIPVLNKNLKALKGLTTSGVEISLAGESLMEASKRFPQKDGRIDLSFNNGRVNLKPFLDARPYINEADLHALLAMGEYEKVPKSMLISPIKKASEELGKQLPKLRELTSNTKTALNVLPDIMGANGKRRYFLAIQNNAELRATGGLIGNYGVLGIDDGKFSLDAFDEIHKLQRPNQPPVDAPQDFILTYGQYKGTSMWLNTNMSPDFPTVSRVLLELYKSVARSRLDGVISIDPVGLKYLLEAIGPVTLPEESVKINASNVVDWTLIEAYAKYQNRDQRKGFLADVAKAVWERIASGQIENKSKLVDMLKLALTEKHMALYSADQQEQKLAENLGYAGALIPTSDDYMQVIMQNHGANKIDVYMHEQVSYSIQLRPDGSALAKVSVILQNKAPASGLPEYVAGPDSLGAQHGNSNTWLNIFVPKGAQLITAMAAGKNSQIDIGYEKDKAVFSQYLELAPGTGKTADLTYELPDVLMFDKDQIKYVLDWQAQPVINIPDITIDIGAPEGFEFSQFPAGFTRKGKHAFHKGVLVKDQKLEFGLIDNR